MAKILYYDLETTGLNHWEHGIHQIAAIVEVDDKIVDKIYINVQPHKNDIIDNRALEVAGITRDTLKTYKPFEDGYKILLSVLSKYCDKYNKEDKFHLVGYNNSGFDNQFFRKFFEKNNDKYFNSWFWIDTIDVMTLASHTLRHERKKLKDFKLSTVCERFGITVDQKKLHDALYDIYLTKELYDQIQRYG